MRGMNRIPRSNRLTCDVQGVTFTDGDSHLVVESEWPPARDGRLMPAVRRLPRPVKVDPAATAFRGREVDEMTFYELGEDEYGMRKYVVTNVFHVDGIEYVPPYLGQPTVGTVRSMFEVTTDEMKPVGE